MVISSDFSPFLVISDRFSECLMLVHLNGQGYLGTCKAFS